MTLIPASGGTPERIATLASGSIHATAVTSPAEYTAEKQGLRTLVSMRDVGKLVQIQESTLLKKKSKKMKLSGFSER